MRSLLRRALLPALAALTLSAADSPDPYRANQVWEYRTRPTDAGSRIKIWEVERDPNLGAIYHIGVNGIPPIRLKDGILDMNAVHLPVSRETMDKSVIRLSTAKGEFTPIAGGIAEWRRAQGGVFTISIAEAIGFAADMVSNNAEGR